MNRRWLAIALIAVATGCSSFRTDGKVDYKTIDGQPLRDSDLAERYFERGLRSLDRQDLNRAEQRFTDALSADVSFAPAHLSLGKVYYLQRRYYLAAWEFDYAHRLSPGRPEPINNLGLVYESTGRLEEASYQYTLAHSLEPENFEYLGNMVRARFRQDDRSDELRYFMQQVVFMDPRPDWRAWAELTLASQRWDPPETYRQEGPLEEIPVGPLDPPNAQSLRHEKVGMSSRR